MLQSAEIINFINIMMLYRIMSSLIIHRYSPFKLLNNPEKLAVIWVNSPLDGQPPADWFRLWNRSRLRYCTDGAANNIMKFCEDYHVKPPQLIAGDFDSISAEAKDYFTMMDTILVHVYDQDSTDLSKTLNLVMRTVQEEKTEIEAIILLGGVHGRFDHVFGALNAVVKHNEDYCYLELPVIFIDNENIVMILMKGTTQIELDVDKITRVCGIIPICQKKTIVTTSGFRWDLDNESMRFGGVVSSSNEVNDEGKLKIETNAPLIFTFELKDWMKLS